MPTTLKKIKLTRSGGLAGVKYEATSSFKISDDQVKALDEAALMSTTRSANDGFLDIIEINKKKISIHAQNLPASWVSIHKQLVDKLSVIKRK